VVRKRRMKVVFMVNDRVSSELRWCGCSAVLVIEVSEGEYCQKCQKLVVLRRQRRVPIYLTIISAKKRSIIATQPSKAVHGHKSI
jgi:hypothetical protein